MEKHRCKPSLTRCPFRGRNCCRPRSAGHKSSSDTHHDEEPVVRSSAYFYTAGSSVRVPWEVWNKPRQSVWLLSRRQKSAQPPVLLVACGSTPPRSLPPPVASAPGKPWKRWCPKP